MHSRATLLALVTHGGSIVPYNVRTMSYFLHSLSSLNGYEPISRLSLARAMLDLLLDELARHFICIPSIAWLIAALSTALPRHVNGEATARLADYGSATARAVADCNRACAATTARARKAAGGAVAGGGARFRRFPASIKQLRTKMPGTGAALRRRPAAAHGQLPATSLRLAGLPPNGYS